MSGYIGAIPVPQATQTRQSFTATAGQTTFATAGYTPQFLDVFMNGVHLLDGVDFTATNGSDVSLTSGAAAGDIIEVVAYSTYQVNDQAFTGNFSVDTDTLYVDSTNNRVGVNTNSPDNTLHVVDTVSSGTIKIGENYNGLVQQFNNDLNIVANGDQAYRVGLGTNNGSGNIVFQTATDTTGNTERMRIDRYGRVGIGVSPSVQLDVYENSNAVDYISAQYKSTAQPTGFSNTKIRLRKDNYGGDIGGYVDQGIGHGLTFSSLAVNTPTEHMRLNQHGGLRVGVTGYTASNHARVVVSSAQYGDWSQRQMLIEDTTSNAGAPAIAFHAPTNFSAGIFKWWGLGGFFECRNNVDNAFVAIGASAFNVNSDYRLKENIVPLDGAADRLASLPVHRFNFIDDIMGHGEGVTVDGFLAHEVADVVPEAVTGEHDAVDDSGNPVYQSIDQSKLVPLLTAALQEAIAKIETLETKVAALENNT